MQLAARPPPPVTLLSPPPRLIGRARRPPIFRLALQHRTRIDWRHRETPTSTATAGRRCTRPASSSQLPGHHSSPPHSHHGQVARPVSSKVSWRERLRAHDRCSCRSTPTKARQGGKRVKQLVPSSRNIPRAMAVSAARDKPEEKSKTHPPRLGSYHT